jgi:hypothetical protein
MYFSLGTLAKLVQSVVTHESLIEESSPKERSKPLPSLQRQAEPQRPMSPISPMDVDNHSNNIHPPEIDRHEPTSNTTSSPRVGWSTPWEGGGITEHPTQEGK